MARSTPTLIVVPVLFMGGIILNGIARADELQIVESSQTPAYVVGSFYTDATNSPNIESVKAWGSYLYLTVRYVNGDQKLEVWDVRDPSHPVMTESLDYGNLIAAPINHWKFPSVNIFDDTIVIRSNFSDFLYHHGLDGRLIYEGWHDFAGEIGEIENNEESLFMSSAASYATFFGRLYDPGDVAPEEEYGYVILNFTNPRRPFVSTLIPPNTPEVYLQQFAGHLTGSLVNAPGTIDIQNNSLSILSRRIQADSFIDVFWKPRIPKIFNTAALDRSIREQIERIVQSQSFTDRYGAIVDRFFNSLEIEPDRTLAEAIHAGYDDSVQLAAVLSDYNIGWDENVRTAVEKIVARHLSLDLEKQLSAELFAPALTDWTGNLFEIPTSGSPEAMRDAIANILDEGRSEETVARYLLDNYIAPLVDVPDWMYWTMEDLVDRIADSDAGEAISVALGGAEVLANNVLFLELALSFIPPAEQFYLPAGFPEDCRELLDYAFFEYGAKLNRKGLAFMELLKFYQYYQGNEGYLNYENEFTAAIRDMQKEISGAMTETVEPFLAALSYVGDIQSRVQAFSANLPCKTAISRTIGDAVAARLEARGVDLNDTVRVALKKHGIYLSLSDAAGGDIHLARVDDFIALLEGDLQEAQTTVQALWNEGKDNVERIEEECRSALAQVLQEAWGDLDLDISLDAALRDYLGNHIDFRWTFGDSMDGLLKDFVYSCLSEYPAFIDIISLLDRAKAGDTIARWQITFQTAAAIAAADPFTLDQSVIYESIELTLEEGYKQAMASAVKLVLMEFANAVMEDMYGSFSAWATRTDAKNYTFQANDLTSLIPIRNACFLWENRAVLVTREEWDYLHGRKLALVVFDPNDPQTTKKEAIFDGWGNVDYIHYHQGNVLVGGALYEGFSIQPTGMLLTIDGERVTVNQFHNLGISTAKGMIGVNYDTHLVFYGPAGVYIATNPKTVRPGIIPPDTTVAEWKYDDR